MDSDRDVRAAVAEGLDLRAVPANLTPELAVARKDLVRPFTDGCAVLKLTDTSSKGSCVYGDTTAKTTVVLFGDSHAASWFPPMNEIALKRHWRLVVLSKGSCTVAAVEIRFRWLGGRTFDECATWRRAQLDRIRELRPALVLMTSTDYDYGEVVDATGDPDRTWANGWAKTADELRSHTRLVWIEDTPWQRDDIVDCVAKHLEDVRPCNRPLDQALLEPRRRQLIRETARGRGIPVIDPVPWFCAPRGCPAIVGNILVTRDGNHTTQAYSTMLTPVLENSVARVLGR